MISLLLTGLNRLIYLQVGQADFVHLYILACSCPPKREPAKLGCKHSVLSSDCGLKGTSCFKFLPLWFFSPAMIGYVTWNWESNEPFLPKVAFVMIFYIFRRFETKTSNHGNLWQRLAGELTRLSLSLKHKAEPGRMTWHPCKSVSFCKSAQKFTTMLSTRDEELS